MTGSGRNRVLKILHVDPEKNWGGGEVQVLGLLNYLADKGHSNHLLTHPRGKLYERVRRRDVRTLPLLVRNDVDPRGAGTLRRLIRHEGYDVVHFHTKRAHALSLWVPRGVRRPRYVVTRRMDYPERKNCYQRFLYNRAVDAVIAISQTVADALSEAGVDRKRIRVIHSGIDPYRFAAKPGSLRAPAAQPPLIGSAGVLEERKGQRHLLQAARLLKDRGYAFRLLIAGEGSLRAELQAQIDACGIGDRVTLAGFVTDMPAFLAQLDAFVLPSLHEGLGVAALEAMAAGKPVVASRVGGLAEVVVDGETGFLARPGDSASLMEAMARLLSDGELRLSLGARGAERVREFFTLERMAARNEDCYYDLVAGWAS